MSAEPDGAASPPAPPEVPPDVHPVAADQAAQPRITTAERARRVLSGHWKAILATFVILAGLGSAYVMTLPATYQATGVISFQPREGEINGRDLVALLVERYPAIVASSTNLGQAATAAGVSASTVEGGLTTAIAPSTLNLTITVVLDSPTQALNAARSLYLSTMQANTTDPYLQALQIQPPTETGQVSGLPKPILLFAVVVLAGLLAAMVGVVADMVTGARRGT